MLLKSSVPVTLVVSAMSGDRLGRDVAFAIACCREVRSLGEVPLHPWLMLHGPLACPMLGQNGESEVLDAEIQEPLLKLSDPGSSVALTRFLMCSDTVRFFGPIVTPSIIGVIKIAISSGKRLYIGSDPREISYTELWELSQVGTSHGG